MRFDPCVLVLLLLSAALAGADNDEAKRKAYLQKRAEETAAAHQTVRELGSQDADTMSADDSIRLSYAYNELGDNPRALEAVCRVPDAVLAERKQLELKAICFHNIASTDKSQRLRELAFIDRCLDRKYGNRGVCLWRKAKIVCQSSVAPAVITRGDNVGSEARIIDREQYEYAFELLTEAFQAEPDLRTLGVIGPVFDSSHDFPLLAEEPRFQTLMKTGMPPKAN